MKMGKSKKSNPEPKKVLRVAGKNLAIEVTENEKKYRNKHGADDVNEIPKDKLKCTVCSKSVADIAKKGVEPFVHMVLGVLMCKECCAFYGDGYFSVDEDGDDKYCRWCGQGGTLYLCSSCSCAFCKKCIKQNLDKNVLRDLESDDWECLICNPKPLYDCRTICWTLQHFAGKNKEQKAELPSRPSRDRKKPSIEKFEASGLKRKASEMSEEEKSDDERSKRRRQSTDVESPKKLIKSDNKARRSRGRPQNKEESTPPFRSRSLRLREEKIQVEEIVISDDDDDGKNRLGNKQNIVKHTKNPTSKKVTKEKCSPSKITVKSKNKTPVKSSNERDRRKPSANEQKFETTTTNPKRPSRNSSKKLPEKGIEDAKEKPQRSLRKRSSYKGSDDEDSSRKKSALMTFEDLSSSESESKGTLKSLSKDSSKTLSSKKTKLSLSKDADEKVVQVTGFINSALKDVKELTILISMRCEKLCSKSIQNSDDAMNVCNKLKQLMVGAHTNLELIEKGLNLKINEWKEISESRENINEESKVNKTTENSEVNNVNSSSELEVGAKENIDECSNNLVSNEENAESDGVIKKTETTEIAEESLIKADENLEKQDSQGEKMEVDEVSDDTEKDTRSNEIEETIPKENSCKMVSDDCLTETDPTKKEKSTSEVKMEDSKSEIECINDDTEKKSIDSESRKISSSSENGDDSSEVKTVEFERAVEVESCDNTEPNDDNTGKGLNEDISMCIGNVKDKINIEEEISKDATIEDEKNIKDFGERNIDNISTETQNEDGEDKNLPSKSATPDKALDNVEEENAIMSCNIDTTKPHEPCNDNISKELIEVESNDSQTQGENLLDFNLLQTLERREVVSDLPKEEGKEKLESENTLKMEKDKSTEGCSGETSHTNTPTTPVQSDDCKNIENGKVEDEKSSSNVENDARDEHSESKRVESKDDNIPKTADEDIKRNSGLQSNSGHTLGDKGRYSHNSQPQWRSNDRNRDYNQGRDRYHRGGSHYRSYDNRWSHRGGGGGGWGYHR